MVHIGLSVLPAHRYRAGYVQHSFSEQLMNLIRADLRELASRSTERLL
ncbi:hypothetical protein [Mesorhizobium sp. B3-1-7]|nr:hypothetical protein [Mesorhizobium sp. B3-1-7]